MSETEVRGSQQKSKAGRSNDAHASSTEPNPSFGDDVVVEDSRLGLRSTGVSERQTIFEPKVLENEPKRKKNRVLRTRPIQTEMPLSVKHPAVAKLLEQNGSLECVRNVKTKQNIAKSCVPRKEIAARHGVGRTKSKQKTQDQNPPPHRKKT